MKRLNQWIKPLVLLLCVCCTAAIQAVFHIKPENSTSTCPEPCLTLNEFAKTDTSSFESVSLVFLPGEHALTSSLVVENKINNSLEAPSNVIIQCYSRGSLHFLNLINLKLKYISFQACSSQYISGITLMNVTSASLHGLNISGSLGGAMLVTTSSVHFVDTIFSTNQGYETYSILKASFSELFFSSDCVFEGNSGSLGGFYAIKSNLTFYGNTNFTGNFGNEGNFLGESALTITESTMYNFGNIKFLYNLNPQPLAINSSVLISNGSFELIGNEAGPPLHVPGLPDVIQLEVTIFITNSVVSFTSLIFARNQGSAYFFNSPFTVTEQLFAYDNLLIQNYSHSTFTMQGSSVNWTGLVMFYNNQAKDAPNATVGIQSVYQTITINGDVSFVNNHADYSAGFFMGSTVLMLNGTLSIKNNSALVAAAGLTLLASSMRVNGLVHISGNSASSDQSAVLVSQHSTINVLGAFEFLDNEALNRAFCILIASSSCTFNGTTTMAGSVGHRPPHYLKNSNVTFAGYTRITDNIVSNDYGAGLGMSQSTLTLMDNYLFENNQAPDDDGGAIYSIDSTIIFAGNGNFTRNTAKHGGALHLFYRSKLIITPNSLTVFNKNIALTGSSIHVEEVISFINCTNDIRLRNVYAEPPTCFFDIELTDTVALKFGDNEAQDGGPALYGGMLNRCTPITQHNQSVLKTFENISDFGDSEIYSAASSDPYRLCFCNKDGNPVCDVQTLNLTSRRGEEFSVSVSVRNELDVGVVALVRSYLVSGFNNTNKVLGNEGILQKVNYSCTKLKFRVSSPNNAEQLTMYAEGPCRDVGNTSKSIMVQFSECPIGFVFDVNTCACDSHLRPYTSSCNIDTGGIERSTNFWVGLRYNDSGNFTGLKFFPNCPFDYCLFPSAPVIMTSPDTQCNYNRSGILCGSCGTDKSLLLGSSICSECSDYYLFLLIPFALMGILLVTCLFLLNLTVQTGAIHGLIFYANIVAVNKAVMVPSGTFKGLSIFLAWLNLDFGIEICFFNGMNQYAKTWLQFVFPGYLLFLVLLIIVVCKLSIPASEKLAKLGDPVFVLATVILLSYTKIVRTILAGLSFASIELSNDLQSAMVWLFDGNLVYAQGNHAILLAFSLAVLIVFVFPYTTMLTFAQFVTESCCISRRSLYKTCYELFKRYHTPYKPNHRYWPGLFLIIRIIILVTFAVNFLGNPSTNLLAISTVCICTGSYTWIVGGVYELKLLKNASEEKRYVNFINNWLLDTLESLFLLNLGIFTAATYHIRATTNSVEDQAILADISLAFTFVLFLLIVGILMYLRFVEYSQYRKNLANGDDENEEETRRLLDVSANYGAAKPNPTVQVIPPPREKFADFSQLREPLLDNQ
ncbi:uncharacterized protein LOC135348059 [Halichondria panicea]|uniref:uncharacterized protein LOC135348059 n=1 Tax=Halichondria panicea TaxID=6063 RepID=UPI00312BBC82